MCIKIDILCKTKMVQFETFDDTLSYIGWGLYSKFVVGAIAFCTFTLAMILVTVSQTIPLLTCVFGLSFHTLYNIQAVLLAGGAGGGYLLNSGSDIFGRKCLITNGLIIIFGSCFGLAFSHGVSIVYISVFFLGAGIEALHVALKIHLAEILPMKRRGKLLVLVDIIGTFGYLFMSLFNFIATDSAVVVHEGMDLKLSSFRILFSVGGGLALVAACITALVEGSPRYFIFKKRNDYAIAVLKQFYTINKSKTGMSFEIRQMQLENMIELYDIHTVPMPVECSGQIRFFFSRLFKVWRLVLIKRKTLIPMLLLNIIRMAMLFGLPGMNNCLTNLISIGNCRINSTNIYHLNTFYYDKDICKIRTDHDLYKNFFIIASQILVGQICLIFIIDRFGRRIPIILGLSLCGTGCIFYLIYITYIANQYVVKIVLVSIIMAAFSIAESATSVVCVEAFPTGLRGTANAHIRFYVNVLSIFVYAYLDVPCIYFLLVLAVIMYGTSAFSFFIPELKGRPMAE